MKCTDIISPFSSAGGWWLRHSQKDGGGRVKRQNRSFTEHPLFTSPFLRIGSRCSSLERSLFLCRSFNGSISLNDVPRLYSLSRVTPAILKCYRAWDSSVHVLGYFRTVREVDYRAIQCGGEGREEGVCVCVCVHVYILYFFFKGGFFCIYFGPVFFKDDLGLQGICVCELYIYIYIYDLTLDFSATRFKHEVPIRTYTWDLTIKTSIWCSSCHGKIKKSHQVYSHQAFCFLFPPFKQISASDLKLNANLISLFYREGVCMQRVPC